MGYKLTHLANCAKSVCYHFGMKRLISYGGTYLFLCIASLPVKVQAQAGGLVPCDGPNCTACDVVSLANNLISLLITLLSIAAVLMFVYTGFKLVTSAGNSSEWEQAKSTFTNVVIGIVLVLTAWLITDTVLRMTTGKGLDGWLSGVFQC